MMYSITKRSDPKTVGKGRQIIPIVHRYRNLELTVLWEDMEEVYEGQKFRYTDLGTKTLQ